ncbi:hypothetical protein FUAX_27960 [Fulvitalea axinellae]|uniref:Uncharacterized protein n=1 Tax=Fulvitalea axinellae TaxID=1182444 RepID=A0AAU9CDY7_9BACT|nr:hypothetical protein FUAX_27960 [Fulvitalea axinellae]
MRVKWGMFVLAAMVFGLASCSDDEIDVRNSDASGTLYMRVMDAEGTVATSGDITLWTYEAGDTPKSLGKKVIDDDGIVYFGALLAGTYVANIRTTINEKDYEFEAAVQVIGDKRNSIYINAEDFTGDVNVAFTSGGKPLLASDLAVTVALVPKTPDNFVLQNDLHALWERKVYSGDLEDGKAVCEDLPTGYYYLLYKIPLTGDVYMYKGDGEEFEARMADHASHGVVHVDKGKTLTVLMDIDPVWYKLVSGWELLTASDNPTGDDRTNVFPFKEVHLMPDGNVKLLNRLDKMVDATWRYEDGELNIAESDGPWYIQAFEVDNTTWNLTHVTKNPDLGPFFDVTFSRMENE